MFHDVIALGSYCGCKGYIRQMKLSSKSYPFDWLLGTSSFNINRLIVNNFNNIFENISIKREVSDKRCFHITDESYDIASIHDVFNNGNPNLSLEEIKKTKEFIYFKDKMNRRIARWNEVIHNKNYNILFIKIDMYKLSPIEETKRLYETLHQMHSNMEFHYLYYDYHNVNIHIDNVKCFKINKCEWGLWETDPSFIEHFKTIQVSPYQGF
jgi:hypothetical protein